MLTVISNSKLLLSTKGTEYESNSQLNIIVIILIVCCCCLPKVLNMKAIHNLELKAVVDDAVVVVYQRY